MRLEHRQHLEERDATGAGRGHGDDVVAAVGAEQRCAFGDVVGLQVGEGDEAAVFLHGLGDEAGGRALVEFARAVFLEAGKRGGEVGLYPEIARFPESASVEENLFRFVEWGEEFGVGAVEGGGDGRDAVAIGGEATSWFANIGPRQFAGAVFLQGEREAGDGAGDAAGTPTDGGGRGAGQDIAVGPDIHIARGGGGCTLAVVEGDGAAVGEADEHETAAADIASEGMHDGECEAGGDGGVDGVAAALEHFEAGERGEFVHGGDHAVLGLDWSALGAKGRREGERQGEQACDEKAQARGRMRHGATIA